jgi:hypothetical protein
MGARKRNYHRTARARRRTLWYCITAFRRLPRGTVGRTRVRIDTCRDGLALRNAFTVRSGREQCGKSIRLGMKQYGKAW